MHHRTLATALVGLAVVIGCRTYNYASPLGPRYAGTASTTAAPAPLTDTPTLRIVTFNVQYAQHIDRAIALLESSAALRDADVIALQEMDAPGTQRIAAALGMSYVYYPASVAPATGRDFGNAILSRWPIVADAKIVLPHRGVRGSERIATAATILVGGATLRVYSVHLGTKVEIGPGARRDQVRAIVADAAPYERVVVGGDMNSRGVGEEFRAAKFAWLTEHDSKTHLLFNWDHIFFRGVATADSAPAGVVRDTLGASDHWPVWAIGVLRPTSGSP